jgi:hypothetical protein
VQVCAAATRYFTTNREETRSQGQPVRLTDAWTVLAALARNLLRWTQLLALADTTVRAARTPHRPTA